MIVGLPDAAVPEAKERVRSAIRNSGFPFPNRRITVNLAPADLRKEGRRTRHGGIAAEIDSVRQPDAHLPADTARCIIGA